MRNPRLIQHFVALSCASIGMLVVAVAQAADDGTRPGDAAMTCRQIAVELAPYAQRMRAPAEAMAGTSRKIIDQGNRQVAREMPTVVALTVAATASTGTPGASTAVSHAEMAEQQRAWNQSMAEGKPLQDKFAAQSASMLATAQAMQSDPRLQRLMRLAQDRHCDEQQ